MSIVAYNFTPKTRQRDFPVTTTAPNIKYAIKDILLFYSKLMKSAFSAIESIEATDFGGDEHKTIPQPPPPSSIPSIS
jgi:hypothetical protein